MFKPHFFIQDMHAAVFLAYSLSTAHSSREEYLGVMGELRFPQSDILKTNISHR